MTRQWEMSAGQKASVTAGRQDGAWHAGEGQREASESIVLRKADAEAGEYPKSQTGARVLGEDFGFQHSPVTKTILVNQYVPTCLWHLV